MSGVTNRNLNHMFEAPSLASYVDSTIGKTISFRPVELERDLLMLHSWHQEPHVVPFWQLNIRWMPIGATWSVSWLIRIRRFASVSWMESR